MVFSVVWCNVLKCSSGNAVKKPTPAASQTRVGIAYLGLAPQDQTT